MGGTFSNVIFYSLLIICFAFIQQVYVNLLMLGTAALHTKMVNVLCYWLCKHPSGEEFSSVCAVKLENGAPIH
jgi:hypothetical protein